jgi:hypothetical protein
MKYATERPYSDPEKAARRLMEHAHAFEPIQDGRIYVEKLNGPFLFGDKGTPAEYSAGLELAIKRAGWSCFCLATRAMFLRSAPILDFRSTPSGSLLETPGLEFFFHQSIFSRTAAPMLRQLLLAPQFVAACLPSAGL